MSRWNHGKWEDPDGRARRELKHGRLYWIELEGGQKTLARYFEIDRWGGSWIDTMTPEPFEYRHSMVTEWVPLPYLQ
jgi:hypothetical protein